MTRPHKPEETTDKPREADIVLAQSATLSDAWRRIDGQVPPRWTKPGRPQNPNRRTILLFAPIVTLSSVVKILEDSSN